MANRIYLSPPHMSGREVELCLPSGSNLTRAELDRVAAIVRRSCPAVRG